MTRKHNKSVEISEKLASVRFDSFGTAHEPVADAGFLCFLKLAEGTRFQRTLGLVGSSSMGMIWV